MKKSNVVFLMLTIIVLIITVVGATFAWFSASVTNSATTAVNVDATAAGVFTSVSGTAIDMDITGNIMASSASNGNTAVVSKTGTIKVTYTAGDTSGSRCTYNVVLNKNTASTYSPTSYYTSNKTTYKFEFSVQASINGTYHGSGTAPSKAETNMSDLTFSSNVATLISGASIQSKSTSAVTDTWDVTLKFYNLPGDQNTLAGFKWYGTIGIANVQCGLAYA